MADTIQRKSTARTLPEFVFDLLLAIAERRRYRAARPPERPIILVCGAPRSGTTLATQLLLNHLPVSFLNNITSMFPRAPLTAMNLMGSGRPPSGIPYHSYYGKTKGLLAPNDALQVWDRWLGADRRRLVGELTPTQANAIARFFGALEGMSDQPFVGKNNNLNAQATTIAAALPTARFLCIEREPLWLAQSLLIARKDMFGRDDRSYGLGAPDRKGDPIDDVCQQVRFHRDAVRAQKERLGESRLRVVPYEEICADPYGFVARVSEELLGESLPPRANAPVFEPSRRMRIDAASFEALKERIDAVLREATARPRAAV